MISQLASLFLLLFAEFDDDGVSCTVSLLLPGCITGLRNCSLPQYIQLGLYKSSTACPDFVVITFATSLPSCDLKFNIFYFLFRYVMSFTYVSQYQISHSPDAVIFIINVPKTRSLFQNGQLVHSLTGSSILSFYFGAACPTMNLPLHYSPCQCFAFSSVERLLSLLRFQYQYQSFFFKDSGV